MGLAGSYVFLWNFALNLGYSLIYGIGVVASTTASVRMDGGGGGGNIVLDMHEFHLDPVLSLRSPPTSASPPAVPLDTKHVTI